jgi:hypothetical protein
MAFAPLQELGAISPAAVEGIGGRNDGRIACVPGILRQATVWAAVSAVNGGRSIIAWLFGPIARTPATPSTAVCGVARCPPARMGQCQPDQAEARITRQKFSGWNEGSLSASTSALTVPKVVSGLCRIPS